MGLSVRAGLGLGLGIADLPGFSTTLFGLGFSISFGTGLGIGGFMMGCGLGCATVAGDGGVAGAWGCVMVAGVVWAINATSITVGSSGGSGLGMCL